MRTVYIVGLIALLVLSAMPFKIRQGGNGYQESMNDVTAGINELGQAFNDAMAAGTDAIGGTTQMFTNLVGGMAGAMGGAAGAGGRLQQGGNPYQNAMAQGMAVFRDLGDAAEDFLNSGQSAVDGVVTTTDQMIDQATGANAAAGGRLQQGGNPFQTAMAQGMAVFRDLGDATEDVLNFGQGLVDGTVQTTDNMIEQTTNVAGAGGRLQQGGNPMQAAMAQGMAVFRDLGEATEDFLNSGQAAYDAATQQTDALIENATGGAAAGRRR